MVVSACCLNPFLLGLAADFMLYRNPNKITFNIILLQFYNAHTHDVVRKKVRKALVFDLFRLAYAFCKRTIIAYFSALLFQINTCGEISIVFISVKWYNLEDVFPYLQDKDFCKKLFMNLSICRLGGFMKN